MLEQELINKLKAEKDEKLKESFQKELDHDFNHQLKSRFTQLVEKEQGIKKDKSNTLFSHAMK